MTSIGLDIGGSKILAGIVDENGNVLHICEKPTHAHLGAESILDRCYGMIDELIDRFKEVDVIGIASAGRIDVSKGSVHYATSNLPGWEGAQLSDLFRGKYGIPVVVENDANAAAIGEGWVGAGKNLDSFVCLTIGTGLGGAFVSNGSVWHGAHWSGAEVGHMILKLGGRNCNCGLRGCAEQYASGNALIRNYNELSKYKVDTAKEVFRRYELQEHVAIEAVNQFVAHTAEFILSLSNIFDPEAFIIGGGIISAQQYWLGKVCSIVQSYNNDIRIETAQLGNLAGIIGVTRLAMDLAIPFL